MTKNPFLQEDKTILFSKKWKIKQLSFLFLKDINENCVRLSTVVHRRRSGRRFSEVRFENYNSVFKDYVILCDNLRHLPRLSTTLCLMPNIWKCFNGKERTSQLEQMKV